MKTVVILSDQKLHLQQGAAYSRIINYAKALTINKNVKVYLCSFQLSQDLFEYQEIFEHIFIIGKPQVLPGTKYSKYFEKLLFPFRSLSYLLKIYKYFHEEQIAWIFFPVRLFNDVLTLFFIKYLGNQKIYCEKNELKIGIVLNISWPLGIIKKLLFSILYSYKIIDAFLNDRMVRYYGGIIAISLSIEKWVEKRNKNIIRIPILVDNTLYSNENSLTKNSNFIIGFIGSISFKKEGLENLLLALTNFDNVILNIYGSGHKTDIKNVHKIIDDHNLLKSVILHGQKDSEQIPLILSQHNLLILPRPNNTQTKYGFSTKLAEYMASGIPVFVTDVSDNALYIKDGVNGFIISSNEQELIANKLEEIIKRNDLNEIGLRGRKTAIENFDYRIYSDKLYNFLFEK